MGMLVNGTEYRWEIFHFHIKGIFEEIVKSLPHCPPCFCINFEVGCISILGLILLGVLLGFLKRGLFREIGANW
ncbi:hypothetical protein MKW98_020164 [Papaver atlanticum]|uniref:Uncharacterized protein n=1 Tax=Papaver atlanticum TaxID=357466 RepID=A0AAD4SAB4_9MAGN|nr:hypothetical protein MKW98_020164 [Papaver atlanticum]